MWSSANLDLAWNHMNWRKRLQAMVADPRPRSYSYDEAAAILSQLGFECAKAGKGGSHRKWRIVIDAGGAPSTVIIGLLEPSRGNLPPEYIKGMVAILRANNLLPDGV